MPRICLFASEVAAFIACHTHKSRTDVCVDVWRRYRPLSLHRCTQALNRSIHESVEVVIDRVDAVGGESDRAHRPSMRTLFDDAVRTGVLPPPEVMLVASGGDTETVEYILSSIRARIGSGSEQSSLDRYQENTQTSVTERNKRTYRRQLRSGKTTFSLYGKVDGIQDGVVIEHKQRMRQLSTHLYEHDRIQLYVYMFLAEVNKSALVETLHTTGEHKRFDVDFDQSTWIGYLANIHESMDKLIAVLHSAHDEQRIELLHGARSCAYV